MSPKSFQVIIYLLQCMIIEEDLFKFMVQVYNQAKNPRPFLKPSTIKDITQETVS